MSYFTRYYKYLKKHETAGKREVAIRYAKSQADKLNKPLIPDPAVLQKALSKKKVTSCFSMKKAE